MRYITVLSIFCLLLSGCSKLTSKSASQNTTASFGGSPNSLISAERPPPADGPPAVNTTQGKVGICDLLTSKDLQSVQGGALRETKPSARSEGGIIISQCVYSTDTFTNSITLLVAQKAETAGARDPREFWKETFHREEMTSDAGKEKGSDDNKTKADGNHEGDERTVGPQRIAGLGEEAYWTGNRVGGALYVLKGNSYIRISVAGAGDQATKIKKSNSLAQVILKSLE
jgi:hypothetical protein